MAVTDISGFLFLAALSGRFFAFPYPYLYERVLKKTYMGDNHIQKFFEIFPLRSTVLFKITGKEEQARN